MAPRSCCSRVTTFNHSVSTLSVIGYASCVLSLRYVIPVLMITDERRLPWMVNDCTPHQVRGIP